jgi:hypothetical protein
MTLAMHRDMPPAQIADMPGNPKTQVGAGEESKEGVQAPPMISQQVMEQITYEKIVGKLIEYNEKINEGRELSIVEYLKRIDPRSPFMKEYDNQRQLRRGFYEEYKIHCFNYVLLLFESVMRILTTAHKDEEADDPSKGDKLHLYSKNYKRFLENR